MNGPRLRKRGIMGATARLSGTGPQSVMLAAAVCLAVILAGLIAVVADGPAEELYRQLSRMLPGWPWR